MVFQTYEADSQGIGIVYFGVRLVYSGSQKVEGEVRKLEENAQNDERWSIVKLQIDDLDIILISLVVKADKSLIIPRVINFVFNY